MFFVRIGFDGRANGRTVTLGSTAGKNDFSGRSADEIGNVFTRSLYGPGNVSAERMHARGVAVLFTEIGQHGFQHFRSNFGRGIVVNINDRHYFTSSTTRSGDTSSLNLDST